MDTLINPVIHYFSSFILNAGLVYGYFSRCAYDGLRVLKLRFRAMHYGLGLYILNDLKTQNWTAKKGNRKQAGCNYFLGNKQIIEPKKAHLMGYL